MNIDTTPFIDLATDSSSTPAAITTIEQPSNISTTVRYETESDTTEHHVTTFSTFDTTVLVKGDTSQDPFESTIEELNHISITSPDNISTTIKSDS